MSGLVSRKKRILQKILVATGTVFAIIVIMVIVLVSAQKPEDLHVSNVDMKTIPDGVYTGSADNGLVKAMVSVEVKNGTILNISLIEHEHLLGKKAEKITESIIKEQSLEVDAVASATYSSDTIRKAVENALRQGE